MPKLVFGINTGWYITRRTRPTPSPWCRPRGTTSFATRVDRVRRLSLEQHRRYDANHYWVPSSTTFTPGFQGTETYRGTTSASYSVPAFVADGDPTTRWMSNVDTDFPASQWVYVDLGAAATVSSVQIIWGTPYATSFQVQTWSSAAWPPPYEATGGTWQTTSAGVVTGTGGTLTVAFNPISTEFIRVLMTASSAGANGAYSIAELTAYNGTTEVTKNVASMTQSATTASSTDPANTAPASPWSGFDFEEFMTYVHSFTPTAAPVITVNFGTGTPQEAAAWVHYANVVKGYGIKYWQIGNEMDGNWETGGPLNAQDYVRRYIEYYDAMKAEDPTIMVLGPVSGGITDPSNLPDGNTFIQDFISILHAKNKDSYLGGIDFHWYPTYQVESDPEVLGTVSQLGVFSDQLTATLAATGNTSSVPVFMTEYNIAPSEVAPLDHLVNALWLANSLGEFIHYFGNGGGTTLWNMLQGGPTSDDTNSSVGDFGYLQFNNNAYHYQPHADYWAMQMMSSDWAIGGDTQTHLLVSSKASQPLLASYADLRPDGALSLAVINKDETNAYATTIDLPSFVPASTADVWTFDATNYTWETSTVPYHATPDSAPTHTVTCGASASTPFTFPPASVTILRFAPAAGVTEVVPEAGSAAVAPPVLIDDMSSTNGAQIQLTPQHAGDTAGYWFTYIGGGSGANDVGSITPLSSTEVTDAGAAHFFYTAIGSGGDAGIPAPASAPGIQNAACMWGATPADQYAYAGEGFNFERAVTDGGSVAEYVDISSHRGLQFWIYNALSTTISVSVEIGDKASDPNGGICGTPVDGSSLYQCDAAVFDTLGIPPGWSFQLVPFAALASNPYYGYQQPAGGDMTTAYQVIFQVQQTQLPVGDGGALPFDYCVADIEFYN